MRWILLLMAALTLVAAEDRGAAPPPWPALYRVRIDGREVPVLPITVGTITAPDGSLLAERPETVDPAPAALVLAEVDGPAVVEIEPLAASGHLPLRGAVVRPGRLGLAAESGDGRLRIPVPGPCRLSVEPGGSLAAPLLLHLAPRAPVPAPDDPGITRYFGPGEHLVGELSLPSGSRVYLAPGAVVRGHLVCDQVEDVRIWGRGVLDASRSPGLRDGVRRNAFGTYRVALGLYRSRRIAVEGIAILDSPNWSVQAMDCEDLRLAGLTVVSWRENGDGIDLVSCRRAEVAACLVRSWDDSLCVKAVRSDPVTGARRSPLEAWGPAEGARYLPHPASDLRFRDCVLWCDRAHALEIGFETAGTAIEDVAFERIDVIHALHLAPIDISSGDAAPIRRIRYHDIRIEDPRCERLLNIALGPTYVSIDPRLGLPTGPLEDVQVDGLAVATAGGRLPPSAIAATGAAVRGVSLGRVRIDGRPAAVPADLDLTWTGPVEPPRIAP